MNICMVVDDYLPHSIKVGAKMMHELAVEFTKRGHNVTVFTPNNNTFMVNLDGVKVCYFRSGEVKNTSKIKRAINETLLSHMAWKAYKNYFKQNHHDLIIYYSPSIFFGNLVLRLKKLWNVPSYLILRDFFPQWVIDNGMIKDGSLIEKYFRYFEKINYDAADTIAIQSPKNLEWFQNLYPNKSLDLIYNWASDTPVIDKNNYYRKKYGLKEVFKDFEIIKIIPSCGYIATQFRMVNTFLMYVPLSRYVFFPIFLVNNILAIIFDFIFKGFFSIFGRKGKWIYDNIYRGFPENYSIILKNKK